MKDRVLLKNTISAICCLFVLGSPTAFGASAYGAQASALKDGNASVFYGIVFVISLVLFFAYMLGAKHKERKLLWLYGCIAVADLGYFLLSVAKTLPAALWANRIGYLGSAYAVLAMLIIIAEVCCIDLTKSGRIVLFCITTASFLFAATGGWLNIYYRDVSLEIINGAARLVKHYAPLHILYTFYVVAYFALMVIFVVYAKKKNKIGLTQHAVFLVSIVLCNIAVWGVEQLINIDFEFLSISYIATGIFILVIQRIIHDYNELKTISSASKADMVLPPNMEELFTGFNKLVELLTPSERMVLQCFIEGYDIDETAEKLYISVNTAKKHTANLRRKLELGSKEELKLYIDLYRRAGRIEDISFVR